MERTNCFFPALPGNPIASAAELPGATVPEIHSHVAGTLSNQPTNKNPGPRTGSWLLCSWDRTAGCALGSVGLFCTGSLVCGTGQSGTDGSADGSLSPMLECRFQSVRAYTL